MNQLFEQMVDFFVRDEWPHERHDDRLIVQTAFRGDNGQWTCFGQVREGFQQCLFYSRMPAMVPEEQRPAMAEFITRANYGMIIGNFELDLSDGEVRYKTSLDIGEGNELTDPVMRPLVYANVLTMDRYLPGLMALMHGGKSPEEAIAMVEG